MRERRRLVRGASATVVAGVVALTPLLAGTTVADTPSGGNLSPHAGFTTSGQRVGSGTDTGTAQPSDAPSSDIVVSKNLVPTGMPTFHASNVFLGPPTTHPLNSFDISWVDQAHHRYYLADRSNKSVDILDTQSNLFQDAVEGFVGATPAGPQTQNTSGPNGVVSTKGGNELWVGDGVQNGNSWVRVVNVKTAAITDSVATGGKGRADELAAGADKILIANDAEFGANGQPCPFLSFISMGTHKVLAQVIYDASAATGCPANPPSGAMETHLPYAATDGLEQPIWDPQLNAFFQAVPLAGDAFGSKGEIDQLDPSTMMVVKRFSVSSLTPSQQAGGECHPQGLVLGSNGHLWAGCNPDPTKGLAAAVEVNPNESGPVVNGIQEVNHAEVAVILLDTEAFTAAGKTAGPDEIWFNPGDHRLYLASSNAGKLSVVDTELRKLIENVTTATGSHSVAADSSLNRIYVPLRNDSSGALSCPVTGCIGVYLSGGAQSGGPRRNGGR